MRFPPNGPGFGFYTVFADVMAGLVFIVCLVIVVGLIVLLVRFLLVATKAAELYVAKNRPVIETTTTPVGTPAATPVATATATTPTPTVTRPAPTTTRTRVPKTPPQA
jgi:hypothetical protein